MRVMSVWGIADIRNPLQLYILVYLLKNPFEMARIK